MCSQGAARGWVAEVGRKHGFRILTGVYPTYIRNSDDLDQAIREVAILRDEIYAWINSDETLDEEEKVLNRERWDRLLARLKQLKNEPDAVADFG